MTSRFRIFSVLLLAGAFVLVGCDQSEQIVEPIGADTYIISGTGGAGGSLSGDLSLTAPDTVDYFVQGFTINKAYTWQVNGSELPVADNADETHVWESRDGEFITVVYNPDDPLTNLNATGETTVTITVDADGDDIEAETIEVLVTMPDEEDDEDEEDGG